LHNILIYSGICLDEIIFMFYNKMSLTPKSTESATLQSKAVASLIAGLLFFIVSTPQVYKLTNSIVKRVSKKKEDTIYATPPPPCPDSKFGPTTIGIGVHSVLFALLTFLLMEL
jgi:hypothetical protein